MRAKARQIYSPKHLPYLKSFGEPFTVEHHGSPVVVSTEMQLLYWMFLYVKGNEQAAPSELPLYVAVVETEHDGNKRVKWN